MAKQWYDYGLLSGEGDSGIEGEHGTDFNCSPCKNPGNQAVRRMLEKEHLQ